MVHYFGFTVHDKITRAMIYESQAFSLNYEMCTVRNDKADKIYTLQNTDTQTRKLCFLCIYKFE